MPEHIAHMPYKILSLLILFVYAPLTSASNAIAKLETLEKASLLVANQNAKAVYSRQAEQQLIPASTVKILTALIAMNAWGADHQFSTHFYFGPASSLLWIKGLGDPFLISEELDLIVQQLKDSGLTSISGIGVDETYFDSEIYFDGRGRSNNPYDAPANALAVNFNTVQINIKNGDVMPGEKQTPITSMAVELSQGLPDGEHRINLKEANRSAEYFIEVLSAKLRAAGISVDDAVIESKPADAKLLINYKNSHSVSDVVGAMLLYSNNFIANQLYLMLGAERYGQPATLYKAHQMVVEFIANKFAWEDYVLVDGSGLSRKNRLSALQLVSLLDEFQDYRSLLPSQNPKIFAKSGTLKGISTYAGYLYREHSWWPFALMINQKIDYKFRERLAKQLLTYQM